MKNIAEFAKTAMESAARLNGHGDEDWKTLASVRSVTTPWAAQMAKALADAVYEHPGTSPIMNKYDRSDRERSLGVWLEKLLSGAPGDSFWAETAIVGFYHAAAGVNNQHVLSMYSTLDAIFLADCTKAFPGPKALQVYQAFHKVFGLCSAVMVESYEHAIVHGMGTLGFNEKLMNRMRTVAIRKMIDEGRDSLPLMVWDDALSVGVAEVDRQHKVLIDLLNQLHAGKTSGKGNDVLKKILGDLTQYTVEHFGFEEKLLDQHAYPELPGHKDSHHKLTSKVIEFKTAFESGKGTLSAELFMFLRSWLNGHIRGSDRHYGQYLNAKGVH